VAIYAEFAEDEKPFMLGNGDFAFSTRSLCHKGFGRFAKACERKRATPERNRNWGDGFIAQTPEWGTKPAQ